MRLILCLSLLASSIACRSSEAPEGPTFYPDDPAKIWSVAVGPPRIDRVYSVTPPAIGADGTIYVGGTNSEVAAIACLYAFRPDGSAKQRLCASEGHQRRAPRIWVTPTLEGDGAFAVDEAGGMYAMRSDGTGIYKMLPGASWGGDPVLMGPIIAMEGGRVLAGGGGAMYILEIEDPHDVVKWRMNERATGGGRLPLIYAGVGPDGRMYASGRELHVYNRVGSLIWEAETGGGTEGGPVFGYEGSLIVRMHRGLVALSPAGDEIWEIDPGQPVLGAPRLDRHGNTYFSTTRSLFATNQVGKIEWELPHDQDFTGAIVVQRNTIYVTDVRGRILGVDMDGNEKWTIDVGSFASTPAVDDFGTVMYVATGDGRLYALVPPSS